jgi:hypothetical protein
VPRLAHRIALPAAQQRAQARSPGPNRDPGSDQGLPERAPALETYGPPGQPDRVWNGPCDVASMTFLQGLLKEKPRSAEEVVGKACAALEAQAQANSAEQRREKQVERAKEDVDRYLNFLKQWLFGDDAHEATKENAIAIAAEACRADLLALMARLIPQLDFEARKDVAQIFGAIVRIKDQDEQPIGAQYVRQRPDLLDALVDG